MGLRPCATTACGAFGRPVESPRSARLRDEDEAVRELCRAPEARLLHHVGPAGARLEQVADGEPGVLEHRHVLAERAAPADRPPALGLPVAGPGDAVGGAPEVASRPQVRGVLLLRLPDLA